MTKINKEYSKFDQEREKQFQEMDRIAKMLIRRDLELSEIRAKREEEESKIRSIIASLVDGLIVFDKKEKIILINPEAENILGLKEKQVLGKKIDQLLDFPNLIKLYQILGEKIEWTGQKYELILEKLIKRYFQVSVVPFVVVGEKIGLMVILHDITRGKEVERLKTEFVSIAAHQLRTPLSAVKWSLHMILDGDAGKVSLEQIEFLEKAYQSNERMILLINDLLNVARIEEGRFIYDLSLQSIEKIIEKSIDNLKELSNKKEVELVFKKPKESLPKIKIDKKNIEFVIQNLLDNAIRFNKPGGKVTISVKSDKINIEVMVEDTGIGIPYLQQNRIFNKFFRADNVIKLDVEGTGLGLFICKNIIEAHKGKIWFESKKDKGTIFSFSLPIKS